MSRFDDTVSERDVSGTGYRPLCMTNTRRGNCAPASASDDVQVKKPGGFIDIHCHCLPGLDDGPRTMLEALSLCRMLAEDGIVSVVATPHQLGRFEGLNEGTKVRQAVRELNESLQEGDIPLEVLPGGEVRVDERISSLLATDDILTLADGGKYLLLELPPRVFIDIEPLLVELHSAGIQPVISHAEMIAPLGAQPKVLHNWLEHSARLQITAASLVKDSESDVCRIAWEFLRNGWAQFVATDSHSITHRRPQMRAAFEQIKGRLGEDVAHWVCIENPSRIVNSRNLLPVTI